MQTTIKTLQNICSSHIIFLDQLPRICFKSVNMNQRLIIKFYESVYVSRRRVRRGPFLAGFQRRIPSLASWGGPREGCRRPIHRSFTSRSQEFLADPVARISVWMRMSGRSSASKGRFTGDFWRGLAFARTSGDRRTKAGAARGNRSPPLTRADLNVTLGRRAWVMAPFWRGIFSYCSSILSSYYICLSSSGCMSVREQARVRIFTCTGHLLSVFALSINK